MRGDTAVKDVLTGIFDVKENLVFPRAVLEARGCVIVEHAGVHVGVAALQEHHAHVDTLECRSLPRVVPKCDVGVRHDAALQRVISNSGIGLEVVIQDECIVKPFATQRKSERFAGFLGSLAGELDGGVSLGIEIHHITTHWRENTQR